MKLNRTQRILLVTALLVIMVNIPRLDFSNLLDRANLAPGLIIASMLLLLLSLYLSFQAQEKRKRNGS